MSIRISLTVIALATLPVTGLSATRPELHLAAKVGSEQLATLVLGAGADVDGTDELGITPLLYAAEHGHDRIVEILLQEGADIEAKWEGWTPLSAAASNGHKDVVERLLAGGALTNLQGMVGGKDEIHVAPMFVASQNGHADVVESLLSAGADVNVTLAYGNSPLHTAAFHGQTEIVEILIAAGAEVDGIIVSGKHQGTTPLHYAALMGNNDSLEVLLKSGADPNARNVAGLSPLQKASCFGNRSSIDKLAAHGAVSASDLGSGTVDECVAMLGDYPKWALNVVSPIFPRPWSDLTDSGDFCSKLRRWYPHVICDDFGK